MDHFKYILQSTHREREEKIKELKALYFGALDDNTDQLDLYRKNRQSKKAYTNYIESCQRLGAITDILETLNLTEEVTGSRQ